MTFRMYGLIVVSVGITLDTEVELCGIPALQSSWKAREPQEVTKGKFKVCGLGGDWGDRHGVHTLRLTVRQYVDFLAKSLAELALS